MIPYLSLDYAHARVAARIAQRPDARAWAQLRTARGVPALLQMARAGAAAALVSGILWPSTPDTIEAALRQVVRNRIREVARWAPDPWQPALLWTLHLVDLPALVHLLDDAPLPAWIALDAVLAPLAAASHGERLLMLARGPLGPIAAAAQHADGAWPAEAAIRFSSAPTFQPTSLHPALSAWRLEWHARWPGISAERAAALQHLERLVVRHVENFAKVQVSDAAAARLQLERAVAALWRRSPGEPVGLFAALVLFALDTERMRIELAPRVAEAHGAPVRHQESCCGSCTKSDESFSEDDVSAPSRPLV